eukprot:COSAG04_NODE_2965_length_3338_cov_7.174128_3_plen_65_part_00
MQLSMDSYGNVLHIHMTSERRGRTRDLPVTPELVEQWSAKSLSTLRVPQLNEILSVCDVDAPYQ